MVPTSAYSFSPVEEVVDIAGSLMVDSEHWP